VIRAQTSACAQQTRAQTNAQNLPNDRTHDQPQYMFKKNQIKIGDFMHDLHLDAIGVDDVADVDFGVDVDFVAIGADSVGVRPEY
jgi:hypothetical protein